MLMMLIDNKYELGQRVYLNTDKEQKERLVVQLTISCGSQIRYNLVCGTEDTWHYDQEISAEKDVLKATIE